MAARFKRDLEAISRQFASEAANFKARADAARKAAEGDFDLSAETDAKKLQAEFEAKVREKQRIESAIEERQKAVAAQAKAKQELEKAVAAYQGPSAKDAKAGLDEQNKILDVAMKDRIRLQAELDEATKLVSVATANRDNAARIFNFAENHEQFVAAWRQKVDGDLPEPISNSKLQIAAAEADIAREAIETAQIVRKAKEHIAEAEKRDKEAESAKEQAEKLRQAAQAVDSVLSGIVAQSGVPLQIEPINGQMRLTVAAGDRRGGRECFAEMSEGERWRMALDIAIKAVGSGGMITIPQNAFEGLDPVNRAAIAQQLEAGGVIAFTAEASEGELRAELYNGVAP